MHIPHVKQDCQPVILATLSNCTRGKESQIRICMTKLDVFRLALLKGWMHNYDSINVGIQVSINSS
jgi:hypothetical protein